MNELMIFEGQEVEVIEFNGQILFNPKHVAECLEITDVNSSIRNFNEKQVVKLTNSKLQSMHFRKLHNTGENFLTESGVYKLVFKSHKPDAEKFTDWIAGEVLPSIRKTGTYTTIPTVLENIPVGEIANLTKVMDKIMVRQKSKPHEIAQAFKTICSQFRITLPDNFVKVAEYEQFSMFINTDN